MTRLIATTAFVVCGLIPISTNANIAPIANAYGVHPDYALRLADRESAMRPYAKARSSSAAGLYQFLNQTWLNTIKRHGTKLGVVISDDQWEQTENGWNIKDRVLRKTILDLRYNVDISTAAVALFTRDNADYLYTELGMAPTQDDLYLAHFMGAGGAVQMLELYFRTPWEPAASYFPKQARANLTLFYKDGVALNIADVRENLRISTRPLPAGELSYDANRSVIDFETASRDFGASITNALDSVQPYREFSSTAGQANKKISLSKLDVYTVSKKKTPKDPEAAILTKSQAQNRALVLLDIASDSPYAPAFAHSVDAFVLPGGTYTNSSS